MFKCIPIWKIVVIFFYCLLPCLYPHKKIYLVTSFVFGNLRWYSTHPRYIPPRSVSRDRQLSRHMRASHTTKTSRCQDLTTLAYFTAIISRPMISQMNIILIESMWRSGSRNLSASFMRGIFHTDTGKRDEAAKLSQQWTVHDWQWSPNSFVCGREH